jgi:serine/threonine-protein kinase
LAEKAVAATGRTNAAYLDTLAAAYAEAGQFTNAVNVQKEAIAVLQIPRWKEGFVSRLRLYEAGQPFREAEKKSAEPPP